MSYLISVPELVEAAGQDLAGIRSALSEATASAAASTTGIAAAGSDEISIAISGLFASHGQEFQALSAEAASFHQRFVGLLNATASQYAGAEAGAQALLAGSAAAGSPLEGFQSFLAAVAGPYQNLFQTTGANVRAIQNTFSARPFPFLNQVLANQGSYLQQAATGGIGFLQTLPQQIANFPTAVQAAFNSVFPINTAPLTGFFQTQVANLQTTSTALQAAGQSLATGFSELPPYLNTAFQDLIAGDLPGAWGSFAAGIGNIVLPGFAPLDVTALFEPLPITVLGPLGDLKPILDMPGQALQGTTNNLPFGSIPRQFLQNVTNAVTALTDTGSTLNINLSPVGDITFGLPLQVIFDSIGVPVNTGSALWSSATAITGALQTGDYPGALAAVLSAPAVVANGALNGSTLVPLPELSLEIGGVPFATSTAYLPVGGLLTPLSNVFADGTIPGTLGGTQVGGFIPGWLSWAQQLADAITPLG